MTKRGSWYELYQAAMLELDRAKLVGRIDAARAVMRERIAELMGRPAQDFVLPDLVLPDLVLPDLALGDHAYREEIRAIDYALQALETLQRVELRSPAEAIEQPGTRSAGIAS